MLQAEFLCHSHAIGTAETMTRVSTVSFSELRSLLASGRARLFDVRSREEAAAGTIPGALNIPGPSFEPQCATGFPFCPLSVSELENALHMDPAAFQALYCAEKPKLEDKNLIFFCQMGRRGLQATQLAQGLGYTGARNYAGAYKEWLEKEG
ncbi:thiosulfate:glutathione sulfurtransferase isoform X1 [Psammomys obesus]|uniref:thiosulfate:glutathione sulfurtransferase isoform X1 n=1 Tax=Psammomys obesus TaxID=48139 RepID=UPI002452D492|nr:thiosulfate:glutathione sulfurtransferase isoform X1 [Psammomys obesus]